MRAALLLFILTLVAAAQTPAPLPSQNAGDVYICPMDPDVRSNNPGKCARCGMALVAGLPDPVEYHLDLYIAPRTSEPGQPARLTVGLQGSWKNRTVTNFQRLHEKWFDMFVVSQALDVFGRN